MVNKNSVPPPPADRARAARLERRRTQSREEILAATRTILQRDGLASFTLDAVARELQLTKAALYYYFPSKDALLFEALRGELRAEADAIAAAVEGTASGPEALRALVETVFEHYGGRTHAFRLAYLYGQVAGAETSAPSPEMLEKVRPINDLIYGSLEQKLEADARTRPGGIHPRRLAFIAHMAAVGLLTMKGLVEAHGDPLVHSDADLSEELIRVLQAAAGTMPSDEQ
jgi:AcrR family transcriptional regulator